MLRQNNPAGDIIMIRFARVALSALVLVAVPALAQATDYKKVYCGKKEYVGNPSNKYPHLHCGSNFYTYSKGSNDHLNMVGKKGPQCGTARNAQEQIHDLDASTVQDKPAMVTSVDSFVAGECQ